MTPPSSDGGSPITGYTVTAAARPPRPTVASRQPVPPARSTVPGLTNGDRLHLHRYGHQLHRHRPAVGRLQLGHPGGPDRPRSPHRRSRHRRQRQRHGHWTAPASNGGSAITGYVITPSTGPAVYVGNVTSDDVTGLTNGTSYTFTVAATNAINTGAPSAPSNSVTPEAPAPPPATPPGYWVVTADGGVFPQGSASSHGSASSVDLNAPIVGAPPLPDGRGYWLVASDGGVFAMACRLLRLDGRRPSQRTHRGNGFDARRKGLLAGGLRWRRLRLR